MKYLHWSLSIFLLAACTAASADDGTLRLSLSSKRAMWRRFQKQLETAAEADAGRLKQKIGLLEKEIDVIERQLDSKPAEIAQSLAKPSAPAPLPPPPPTAKADDAPPAPGTQRSFEELQGSDWPWLKPVDRERFVSTTLKALEKNGVVVMGNAKDYTEKVDAILKEEPAFEEEYLADLVVFSVYDSEPQTREAIHQLREDPAAPSLI